MWLEIDTGALGVDEATKRRGGVEYKSWVGIVNKTTGVIKESGTGQALGDLRK